ncbi:MAG: thioredoxin [Candidatus Poseidoniales archaeon]|nr:MAG: thioredoxin [Candidatus Poseidoniales archaeon]|tara:strand:- start:1542 stop:2513 length:972 start_codon:yes stop_codon:yes gene_type:complete
MAKRWMRQKILPIPNLILAIVVFILLTTPSSSAVVIDAANELEGTYEASGGRTILVEELSATWCSSCSEIDPYLMEVADSHGSRISIVTYHPSDDVDAFQPEASQHRIDRLKITHPEIGSTPSFVVDGGKIRVGPESWPDVQKDILTKEVNNPNPSELNFEIQRINGSIEASIKGFNPQGNGDNISQLTFMLAEHSVKVPNGFANPGESTRDRVVTGVAECNLQNNSIGYSNGFSNVIINDDSCTSGFSVTLDEDISQFSLVLVHERVVENLTTLDTSANTYGVVEFSYRDVESSESWNNLMIILIGFTIIGFLWHSYQKTKN